MKFSVCIFCSIDLCPPKFTVGHLMMINVGVGVKAVHCIHARMVIVNVFKMMATEYLFQFDDSRTCHYQFL